MLMASSYKTYQERMEELNMYSLDDRRDWGRGTQGQIKTFKYIGLHCEFLICMLVLYIYIYI